MKIDLKLVGGVLLIVGTSIGAAMLALPVSNSQSGFVTSTLFLFVCWLLMTFSAFLILEVNMTLPPRSNIVSMAQSTLGRGGEVLAWASYLLLLYSLLSAYISGGADVFQSMLELINIHAPQWVSVFLFTGLLGAVVYKGIKAVDYVNRGLMSAKLIVYVLLVVSIMPFVDVKNLMGGQPHYIASSIMVLITSFGSATIVPSLRTYFEDDVRKLREVILIGSLIPLVCYTLWDLAIMGTLPAKGEFGLLSVLHSEHATTGLVTALMKFAHSLWITDLSRLFVSVCMLTSFLGVALCMTDFLADGFNISKHSRKGWIVFAATFIPPLVIAIFYPGAFITALSYAGIFCVILLAILPALMAWSSRYIKNVDSKYTVRGGKPALAAVLVTSVIIIVADVTSRFIF